MIGFGGAAKWLYLHRSFHPKFCSFLPSSFKSFASERVAKPAAAPPVAPPERDPNLVFSQMSELRSYFVFASRHHHLSSSPSSYFPLASYSTARTRFNRCDRSEAIFYAKVVSGNRSTLPPQHINRPSLLPYSNLGTARASIWARV